MEKFVPDLSFAVEDAFPIPYAVSPTIGFKLRVNTISDLPIHSVVLRVQIMIEATRRLYTPEEQANLHDLFGEPERWSQTLKAMLWTHTSIVIPPFEKETGVDLPVPCTFDFNVAGTKYFHGLEEGEIPLILLFSGTIFYANEMGMMQISQISWESEARYRLPVQVWKNMMDAYYPNTAWLCLQRDVFEKLNKYKMEHGIPTWEQLFDLLVPQGKLPT
jgi:hypothetical protein